MENGSCFLKLVLSNDFIKKVVKYHYQIEVVSINLVSVHFNDTYLIEDASSKRYYLTVHNPATRKEKLFEIVKCQNWLMENGVNVVLPIMDKILNSQIGFTEIGGVKLYFTLNHEEVDQYNFIDKNIAQRIGRAIAKFHKAGMLKKFDLNYLCIESVAKKSLEHLKNKKIISKTIFEKHAQIIEQSTLMMNHSGCSQESILIHGDFFYNFFISKERDKIIFYDLELLSYSSKMYELSQFFYALTHRKRYWYLNFDGENNELWSHFLMGYREVGDLGVDEESTLLHYLIMRVYYDIERLIKKSHMLGRTWLNGQIVNEKLNDIENFLSSVEN